MLTKYLIVIQTTVLGFFPGLTVCLTLIKNPIEGFIVFNLGAFMGLMLIVILELPGVWGIKGLKKLFRKTKWGRFLIRRKLIKDRQNKHKRKKISELIVRYGARGLFVLTLIPIPYWHFVLVSVWLALKVKNGLIAIVLGNFVLSSISITIVYVMRGQIF